MYLRGAEPIKMIATSSRLLYTEVQHQIHQKYPLTHIVITLDTNTFLQYPSSMFFAAWNMTRMLEIMPKEPLQR